MTRHPAHARLDALVGDWQMRAEVDGDVTMRGTSTVAWIEDGAFLLQRSDSDDMSPEWTEHSPFPTTAIIALDDDSATFTYSYADGRGVCRVYEMSLDDERWTLRGRPGPEFFQRFAATFQADGAAIRGHWDRSCDGESWERDFDVIYTRVSDEMVDSARRGVEKRA
jgi:hypothetical protein